MAKPRRGCGFGASNRVHRDRMSARVGLVRNSMRLASVEDRKGNCHEALRFATEAEHYMGMVEAEAYSIDPNMRQANIGALAHEVANLWGALARKCIR